MTESQFALVMFGIPIAFVFGLWLGHDATRRFHLKIERFSGGRSFCVRQWYADTRLAVASDKRWQQQEDAQ